MINIINMKNPSWIDRATACAKLGVKPQTLYAYVGRKHVRVKPDTRDARRSLYALSDIEALATQSKRPRARLDVAASAVRWGDPILQTSITEVRAGMLWLRSLPVSDCAERMTHEQVTAHLCDRAVAYHDDAQSEVTGRTPFARAMKFLALETDTDVSRDDSENLGGIISGVTNACLGRREDGLIHERLARAWALDAAGSDLIRRALVLLSDHELNPSTFAVRVCAGTGASLPAALLAGMAT
ncbi:MAG: citrate/2-methylcitrate synthase, partial [Pseudomonadota bacterium]